jgi:hypothetical protein
MEAVKTMQEQILSQLTTSGMSVATTIFFWLHIAVPNCVLIINSKT